MKGTSLICVLTLGALLCSSVVLGQTRRDRERRHLLIIEPGLIAHTYSGGNTPRVTVAPGFSFRLARSFSHRLQIFADFASGTSYTDSTATSSFQFGSESENRVSSFKTRRISAGVKYYMSDFNRKRTLFVGVALGSNNWKGLDASGETQLDTLGVNNTRTEFKAQEFIISGLTGLSLPVSNSIGIGLELRGDYLTGAGAEFAQIVNDERPNVMLSAGVSLTLAFGVTPTKKESWKLVEKEDKSTDSRRPPAQQRDSDGDGIPDIEDRCAATPRGAEVNSAGCPTDNDGDGVFDGLDDCPETPPTALGLVDIYGCPIDSDFDGKADYEDRCPDGPIGAHIDTAGCPLDGDNDGVPDGLDDCPATDSGLVVDASGCLDLTTFDRPLILNIKYEPGSFEIDRASEKKLRKLIRLLEVATEVSLEVIGYTDNIGRAPANQKLSEKRARRVRDFLIRLGLEKNRIKALGRGESNFVADNKTRAGRQRNRRIEIHFRR